MEDTLGLVCLASAWSESRRLHEVSAAWATVVRVEDVSAMSRRLCEAIDAQVQSLFPDDHDNARGARMLPSKLNNAAENDGSEDRDENGGTKRRWLEPSLHLRRGLGRLRALCLMLRALLTGAKLSCFQDCPLSPAPLGSACDLDGVARSLCSVAKIASLESKSGHEDVENAIAVEVGLPSAALPSMAALQSLGDICQSFFRTHSLAGALVVAQTGLDMGLDILSKISHALDDDPIDSKKRRIPRNALAQLCRSHAIDTTCTCTEILGLGVGKRRAEQMYTMAVEMAMLECLVAATPAPDKSWSSFVRLLDVLMTSAAPFFSGEEKQVAGTLLAESTRKRRRSTAAAAATAGGGGIGDRQLPSALEELSQRIRKQQQTEVMARKKPRYDESLERSRDDQHRRQPEPAIIANSPRAEDETQPTVPIEAEEEKEKEGEHNKKNEDEDQDKEDQDEEDQDQGKEDQDKEEAHSIPKAEPEAISAEPKRIPDKDLDKDSDQDSELSAELPEIIVSSDDDDDDDDDDDGDDDD